MYRVLILCEYASLNGGERSLLAVVGQLADHGFQPTAAAPPDGPLAEALRDAEVPLVPLVRSDSESQAARRDRLRTLLVEHAPDVVHANSLSMSRLSGPVTNDLQLPSVGHLRDIMRLSGQAVRDVNQHTRLLAVSAAVKRWYVDAGVTGNRIAILHNGVDLQRFRPRPKTGYLSRELQLPSRSHLVVSIGQIGMRKGLDLLVTAASQVIRHRQDVHFLHVGLRYSEKQEAIEFERRVRHTSGELARHFHWLGLRDDVPSIMNEASLVVHTARQEPLGRVLLESAAAATPVVATDVGGTAEIFPRGCQAARLVPPEQPDALAAAILQILADEELQRRMSAAGRCLAEERFDAKQAAASLARHYEAVVESHKAGK
ncbi:MAG: glycosyltransferase family 4 protein [Pirellulaceae bacterium]